MRLSRPICAFLPILLMAGACTAETSTLSGSATIIDGDTFDLGERRVRLWGIDAPEGDQICQDASGRDYRCGPVATQALAQLIGADTISCEVRDEDRYDRAVAVCERASDGAELNAGMVRAGYALDYEQFSDGAYRDAELAAFKEKRGLWVGMFKAPWLWRAQRRAD